MAEFFLTMGYTGLFLGSFALGWIIPGSTELLMAGCLNAGMNWVWVLFWATMGADVSGIVLYGLGRLGNLEKICKWVHVKPERVSKYQTKIKRHGSWMALLAWIPYGGEAICVALGLCRTKIIPTFLLMLSGKAVRYTLMLIAILGLFQAI